MVLSNSPMAHTIASKRPTTFLWLLPLGFILHDGEELMTMSRWIARHQNELQRMSSFGGVARRLVESAPSSEVEIAFSIAVELAVLLAVTGLAISRPDSRNRLYAYSALLGVFVAHALTHTLLVMVFYGYVPGAISAVTIIPAVGIIVYRRLFTSGALTPRMAIATTAAGAVVFLPLFGALLALARRVDGFLP